jgi:hypothetical protein
LFLAAEVKNRIPKPAKAAMEIACAILNGKIGEVRDKKVSPTPMVQ